MNRIRIAFFLLLVTIGVAVSCSDQTPQPGQQAQAQSGLFKAKYVPPGTLTPVAQIMPTKSLNLGAPLSDAGVTCFDAGADANTYVTVVVCGDEGNLGYIYCAADPSVNATPGSTSKGTPIGPSVCQPIYVSSPNSVCCAPISADGGTYAIVHSY